MKVQEHVGVARLGVARPVISSGPWRRTQRVRFGQSEAKSEVELEAIIIVLESGTYGGTYRRWPCLLNM